VFSSRNHYAFADRMMLVLACAAYPRVDVIFFVDKHEQ
jgi:hypothetical protein